MTQHVITFHYELSADRPLSILQGAGQIIPQLETVLAGLNKGDRKDVFIAYRDAYGPYDQILVAQTPRNQFPNEALKAGDMFEIKKEGAARIVTIVEVAPDRVTVDANHPMAGKDLNFSIEVIEKRQATTEEIAHGHVH